MNGNVHTPANADRSERLNGPAVDPYPVMTMPHGQGQMSPFVVSSQYTLPAQINRSPTLKQHSEPLDLSKSTVPLSRSLTCQSRSKLEQMLSSNSTSASGRKRPYSCLYTAEKRTRPLRHSYTVVTPGVFSMDEAPDNPVILVELSPETSTSITEKFSCSLIRMMSKVFTISQFSMLSEQEKVALLQNSWHRLMLWSLANDAFTFTVSPLKSQPAAGLSYSRSCKRNPTMAFVRGIAVFMKKFASLHISAEELSLLFGITLFHADKPSICVQSIEEKRKDLMRQLQILVLSNSSEPNRYTDLLLCLPLLYSVDEGMFENLFCGKGFGNGDVKLLLKDAVRQVTKKLDST